MNQVAEMFINDKQKEAFQRPLFYSCFESNGFCNIEAVKVSVHSPSN